MDIPELFDRRIAIVVEDVDATGAGVSSAVLDRIDQGATRFWVVAPVHAPKRERAWSFLDVVRFTDEAMLTPAQVQQIREALHESTLRHQADRQAAWQDAQRRLEQTCDAIRAAGGTADGVIVNADVPSSLREALRGQPFREVILYPRHTWVPRLLRFDTLARTVRGLGVPVAMVPRRHTVTTPMSTATPDGHEIHRAA